ELRVKGVGHQPRQRRLADAGRTPEDHRVRPARLEGDAQRAAGTEQMRLPDHLVDGTRTQSLGERRRRPFRGTDGAYGGDAGRRDDPPGRSPRRWSADAIARGAASPPVPGDGRGVRRGRRGPRPPLQTASAATLRTRVARPARNAPRISSASAAAMPTKTSFGEFASISIPKNSGEVDMPMSRPEQTPP